MINFIKRFHLRLLVVNFSECFRFYRDVLGLPVRYGDELANYAELKNDILHIALFRRKQMATVIGRTHYPTTVASQDRVMLILRVENIVEVYKNLQNIGVEFVTELCERQEWDCLTAHFRDPDGNLIELNSDLF